MKGKSNKIIKKYKLIFKMIKFDNKNKDMQKSV